MPRTCKYCFQKGHYSVICPILKLDRVLSIFNHKVDLLFYYNHGEWFKDSNGYYPSHIYWKPPYSQISQNIPRSFMSILKFIDYFHSLIRFKNSIQFIYFKRGNIWHKYSARFDQDNNYIIHQVIANENSPHSQIYPDSSITFKYMQHNIYSRIKYLKHQEYLHSLRLQQRDIQQMQYINSIKALPLVDKPIHADECSICFETIGPTNFVVLRCGHMYCGDCIFHHFQRNFGNICPNCRADFAVRIPGWCPPVIHLDH